MVAVECDISSVPWLESWLHLPLWIELPDQTALKSKGTNRRKVDFQQVFQPDQSALNQLIPMKQSVKKEIAEGHQHQAAALRTPTDLKAAATKDIAAAMNGILADVFALYLKTKNFHWHMSGPHFRDYHVMLDEQATQIYEMTDPIAERIRKVGGNTLRSIGHIARTQRILDNDAEYVEPSNMLGELCDDNKTLVSRLREAHGVCEEHNDIATTSLIEVYIDETERRTWFLFEASRPQDATGH